MQRLVLGGLAGLIATAPMTWTMRAAEKLVPRRARGKLPPRQITERILHKTGTKGELDEDARSALATAAHYAFGATAGSALALAASKCDGARPLCGAAFGTAVWAASYLGWLPAVGLRRNAAEEPSGRNVQMVLAHIVWGAVAGAILDTLSVDKNRRHH